MQAALGADLLSIPFETFPAQDRAEELRLYVAHGVRPGAALMALLCADARSAYALGDDGFRARMGALVAWCFERLPIGCHGSPAVVHRWLALFAQRDVEPDIPTFWRPPHPTVSLPRAA